jgi:hypothetical protein
MAKKSNHRDVVFLQDYATKKAGQEFSCDGALARSLVNSRVANYKTAGESNDKPFIDSIPVSEDSNIAEKVSEPAKQTSSTKSNKKK